MTYVPAYWTVWDFRETNGTDIKRVPRRYEIGSHRFEHYFQRIVWEGEARDAAEALHKANMNATEGRFPPAR